VGCPAVQVPKVGSQRRADVAHIEAVQHVEAIGDHFQIEPLGYGELPCDAQVDLKKNRVG